MNSVVRIRRGACAGVGVRAAVAVGAGLVAGLTPTAHGALVELRYALTGEFIQSWGSVGRVRLGDDVFTPITRTGEPIGLAGNARSSVLVQSDGSITYTLGLSRLDLTSDTSPQTSTPVLLTLIDEFEPEPFFTQSLTRSQNFSGFALFERELQRASVSMSSSFGGVEIGSIQDFAQAPRRPLPQSISANGFQLTPMTFGSTIRIESQYFISLSSRGSEFQLSDLRSSATVRLVPTPGVVGVVGAGGAAMLGVRFRTRGRRRGV